MEHLRRSAGQPEVPSKHMIRNTPKQPAKPKAAAFTILSRVPNAEGVLPQSPGSRSAPWGQTPMQILSERRRCSTNGPGRPISTQASPRLLAQTLAPKIVGRRACTTALKILDLGRTTVPQKRNVAVVGAACWLVRASKHLIERYIRRRIGRLLVKRFPSSGSIKRAVTASTHCQAVDRSASLTQSPIKNALDTQVKPGNPAAEWVREDENENQ